MFQLPFQLLSACVRVTLRVGMGVGVAAATIREEFACSVVCTLDAQSSSISACGAADQQTLRFQLRMILPHGARCRFCVPTSARYDFFAACELVLGSWQESFHCFVSTSAAHTVAQVAGRTRPCTRRGSSGRMLLAHCWTGWPDGIEDTAQPQVTGQCHLVHGSRSMSSL